MKTQNEMRCKFEKLEEIKIHLEHGNVFFNEEKQTYASEFSALHVVACYVNGAWCAFQEQQKKIDKIIDVIEGFEQASSLLDNDYNRGGNSICRLILNDVKSVLK